MRSMRGVLLVTSLAWGCKVYDESLLLRRDAATMDRVEAATADLGGDLPRVDAADAVDAPDTPSIDAPDVQVIVDAPPETGADVVDVPTVDVVDVVDAPTPDVPLSCDETLRTGAPCIEPWSGQLWEPTDPRLLAPGGLAFQGSRALVSDQGSGRVISFELTPGATPSVLLGNGILGATPPTGSDARAPLGRITSIAALRDGAIALADATTRQVLRVRGARVEALPMLAFQSAPAGLAWDASAGFLYLSADNRIHRVALDADGGVGAAEAVVGLPCGTNCSTPFNGDGLPGVATAVASPAGLDVFGEFVYFADRDNCLIRRFRRNDADRVVTTFAGTVCDETGDPFAGLGAFATPSQLRLGRVSEVKVGNDGSVYFIDASRCAVFGVTPPRMAGGDAIPRIVAGSATGCGQVAPSGPPLGPLGALAVSADRSGVFFVDLRGQRVGRILGTSNGGSAVIDFPIAPGTVPAGSEPLARARLAGPDAIAASADGSSLVVSTASGRVFELSGGGTRALTGGGSEAPASAADDLSADTLPITEVAGASRLNDRTLLSFVEYGVVAELQMDRLRRLAGLFPQRITAPPLDGGVSDAGADAASDVVDAGPPLARARRFGAITAAIVTPAGVVFGDRAGRVWRIGTDGVAVLIAGTGSLITGMVPPPGGTGIAATLAAIGTVSALAHDTAGRLFVADAARNVVWSVGLEAPPRARIVVGAIDRRGPLSDVGAFGPDFILASPRALAFDGANTIYIADRDANRVRALNVLSGQVTNLAGSGASTELTPAGDYGSSRTAVLSRPAGLAFVNRSLLIAEEGSGRIRRVRLP